jgi:hypothetical protein
MARRNGKTTRRPRRNNNVKLLNVAEGLIQANIVTDTLMGVNALEFVLADTGIGNMTSGGGISLVEIARRPELLGVIGERAVKPKNVIDIALKSAIANIGFRFARKAVARPTRMINKNLKTLQLGVQL